MHYCLERLSLTDRQIKGALTHSVWATLQGDHTFFLTQDFFYCREVYLDSFVNFLPSALFPDTIMMRQSVSDLDTTANAAGSGSRAMVESESVRDGGHHSS